MGKMLCNGLAVPWAEYCAADAQCRGQDNAQQACNAIGMILRGEQEAMPHIIISAVIITAVMHALRILPVFSNAPSLRHAAHTMSHCHAQASYALCPDIAARPPEL